MGSFVKYINMKIFTNLLQKMQKSLTNRKNRKVIGLMKDKFGTEINKEFSGLRAKIYSYNLIQKVKITRRKRL